MKQEVKWVDSHCHLQLYNDFEANDIGVHNTYEANVSKACEIAIESLQRCAYMLCVSTKIEDYKLFKDIKKKIAQLIGFEESEKIFLSAGMHPLDDSIEDQSFDFAELEIAAKDNDIVAIGETGFDFKGDYKKQQIAFDMQAQIAQDNHLPIIMHTRECDEEAISAIKNWPNVKGVLHCFTGGMKLAKFAAESGWKVSFSGIITFKNAQDLRDMAKALPIESILIETDAPYLAPAPFRGKVNKPMYVQYVGEFISNMLCMEYEEFAKIVHDNFFDLFKLRKK
jgi:TatD DNase family protein